MKYDVFASWTLDSILLKQTVPSTFRLSSAYRYLIKSWSFRLVSIQLKQTESWSFRLVSVLLKQAESWSFGLISVCGNCGIIKFQCGFSAVSVMESSSFFAESLRKPHWILAAPFPPQLRKPQFPRLKPHWNYTETWRFRKVSVKIPISETHFMQW